MTLGERLKKARERRGLTQSALAEKVGCAEFSILRWEKGVTRPLDIYLKKLEKVLGIDLKEGNDEAEIKDPSPGRT
jgi:ribosome-binding protein aMBF1 (putative translation factor)